MRFPKVGRRRALAAGVVVCLAAVTVPLVSGNDATPAEVDMIDGVVWLSNESTRDVVRVNGETGRVDARLEVGARAGKLAIEQGDGIVLVDVGGEIRRVDLANLDWGPSIEADASLVVGDGAAYMVSHDGIVRELDPTTLETIGEVRVHATPGPGVVFRGQLVLPWDDGTVRAIEGDEVVAEVEVGRPADAVHVTLVGTSLAILNQTDASLRRFDPATGSATEPVDVELPKGELLVPRELPRGRLWLTATHTGDLVGIAVRSGRAVTVPVAHARSALTAPVAVDGRVYVVDRTGREVVEVDERSLEVVQREPLEVDDAGLVDVVAEGGKVFVNDRASGLAIVIDGDEHTRVDKYRDDDGTTEAPTTDQPDPDPVPAPPDSPTTIPGAGSPGQVGAPTVSPGDGSVGLSWAPAASTTPVTYDVSIAPAAGAPVRTAETAATFSGLTNGVEYTFTIVPVNDGGAGPGTQVVATPGRQPTIGAVAVERVGDRKFQVSFTVDGGGRPITGCSVAGGDAPVACDASSGSVSVAVDVPQFNTGYSFTPSVTNAFGAGTGTAASGTSAGKPLVVEAATARWDGSCTGIANPGHRPRYESAAHACGSEIGWVSGGTTVRGLCHEAGSRIQDDYLNASTEWVRVSAGGYMSTLYFTTYTDTQGTIAGLPRC